MSSADDLGGRGLLSNNRTIGLGRLHPKFPSTFETEALVLSHTKVQTGFWGLTVRLFSFFGGALGRAALIFSVSASASAARKIFSERERERRSEKSGMSASASGARKIRERLILWFFFTEQVKVHHSNAGEKQKVVEAFQSSSHT